MVEPLSCGRDDYGYGFQFETLKDVKKALKAANEALLKGPSETKTTTLEEFLAEMRGDIDKFETYWKKEAAAEPSGWPMTMSSGDWFEQFIAFESREDS